MSRALFALIPVSDVAGSRQESRSRGAAPVELLIVIFGLVLFFAPFLKPPVGMSPVGESLERSDEDIPFEEQLAFVVEEIEFEEDLSLAIESATEEWYGMDFDLDLPSGRLAAAGVIEFHHLAPGRMSYETHCVGCHGVSGDGAGPAAVHLDPRPRNFLSGKFKFTSTATGARPRRADISRTIEMGLAGASMPGFRLIPSEERLDLTEYVRFLAVRGEFRQLMLDVAYDEEELPDPEE